MCVVYVFCAGQGPVIFFAIEIHRNKSDFRKRTHCTTNAVLQDVLLFAYDILIRTWRRSISLSAALSLLDTLPAYRHVRAYV